VHGGGKLATKVAEAMGIKQQMLDGRRITDAETLKGYHGLCRFHQ
jgi:acetylglutamate kinase